MRAVRSTTVPTAAARAVGRRRRTSTTAAAKSRTTRDGPDDRNARAVNASTPRRARASPGDVRARLARRDASGTAAVAARRAATPVPSAVTSTDARDRTRRAHHRPRVVPTHRDRHRARRARRRRAAGDARHARRVDAATPASRDRARARAIAPRRARGRSRDGRRSLAASTRRDAREAGGETLGCASRPTWGPPSRAPWDHGVGHFLESGLVKEALECARNNG